MFNLFKVYHSILNLILFLYSTHFLFKIWICNGLFWYYIQCYRRIKNVLYIYITHLKLKKNCYFKIINKPIAIYTYNCKFIHNDIFWISFKTNDYFHKNINYHFNYHFFLKRLYRTTIRKLYFLLHINGTLDVL